MGGTWRADPWVVIQVGARGLPGRASRPGAGGFPRKWLPSAELGPEAGLQGYTTRPRATFIHPEPSLGASYVTMGIRGQLWAAHVILWGRQAAQWVSCEAQVSQPSAEYIRTAAGWRHLAEGEQKRWLLEALYPPRDMAAASGCSTGLQLRVQRLLQHPSCHPLCAGGNLRHSVLAPSRLGLGPQLGLPSSSPCWLGGMGLAPSRQTRPVGAQSERRVQLDTQ